MGGRITRRNHQLDVHGGSSPDPVGELMGKIGGRPLEQRHLLRIEQHSFGGVEDVDEGERRIVLLGYEPGPVRYSSTHRSEVDRREYFLHPANPR